MSLADEMQADAEYAPAAVSAPSKQSKSLAQQMAEDAQAVSTPAQVNGITPASPGRGVTPFHVDVRSATPAPQPAQATQDTPLASILHGAASLADNVYNSIPATVGSVVYAGERAFGATPQSATTDAGAVANFGTNPLGKAFGIQDTSGYKNEASRQAMEYVGQNIGKGAAWISQNTGLPQADVENMMQTLTAAVPMAAKGVYGAVKAAPAAASDAASQLRSAFAAKTEPVRVDPVDVTGPLPAAPVKPLYRMVGGKPTLVTPAEQQVRAQFEQAKGTPAETVATVPAATEPALVATVAPAGEPVAAPAVIPDGASGSSERTSMLQRVFPNTTIRKSVVNGDVNAAAGDVETARNAKSGDAGAVVLKQAIDNEKAGLESFAHDTAAQAGGPMGLDETGLATKGNVMAAPIDGAVQWFKDAYKKLYQDADAKSGGVPNTTLDDFGNFLSKDSNFSGKAENQSLRNGISSYLKEQGLVDAEGNMQPMTAQQAEGLRQYMNSQWGPATKGLIGKMGDMVDEGVAKSAGEDIYGPARQLFAKKKALFDNPNGIKQLFEFDQQTPINRGVSLAQMPDKLLGMPAAQIEHIMKVYRDMPTPELQALGDKAVQAVQTHTAEKIAGIGSSQKSVWNQKGVVKQLDSNSLTHNIIFNDRPDLLQRLKDTRDAGHAITAEDRSYGGASVQERTLVSRGATALGDSIRQGAPAALAGLAIPATSGLSTIAMPAAINLGNKWKAKAQGARSLADANSRLIKLSDVGK